MKFIGDIVLTTPLIRAVRERYPDAYLAYLGDKEAVTLLANNPWLNEIIPFDFSRPSIIEQPAVMFRLRKRKFDVFIDLFSNPRSALICFASGAPVRIGKETAGRGALYTHRIRDDGKPKTAIAFHYQYVAPIDVQPTSLRTEIFITPEEKSIAAKYLSSIGIDLSRPVAGFHPGATWPAKMWPVQRFIRVADRLAGEGVQVLFTQGPKDGGLAATIRNSGKRYGITLPNLPIRTLAAILPHLQVYVANDCGPMHISVAVGTPTIGIFGPGEENIWFPYVPPFYDSSTVHRWLRHDVVCHPCHLDFCNRTGDGYMECMNGVSEETVFNSVMGLL